jgi:hypothetical protein
VKVSANNFNRADNSLLGTLLHTALWILNLPFCCKDKILKYNEELEDDEGLESLVDIRNR